MGPGSCEATRRTRFGDIFNVPRTVHVETAAIVANSSPLTQPTLKARSKRPWTNWFHYAQAAGVLPLELRDLNCGCGRSEACSTRMDILS